MPRYDARRIENKWQQHWEDQQTFRTPDPGEEGAPQGEKLYVLDMFPYPSGNGLHVGHPEGYTATDIVCRYGRMKGRHVLHPMGWDAFGLPAEQHAIKTGTHPRETTKKNIDTFRRQLKMLGFSYDWNRELSTTDPDYFRWTQWIFLQLYDTWYDPQHVWTGPDGVERTGRGRPISELPIPPEVSAEGDEAVSRFQDARRLAYQHEAPVNWCPKLGTVLANEEVSADGLSEQGHPVERLPMRQWMLRITAYADRLLQELDGVDWTESIKLLQRNWIGRSEGAEVDFYIGMGNSGDIDRSFTQWKAVRAGAGFPAVPGEDVLRVYTTRPDTLYGATYMVLAPEHAAVNRLATDEQKEAVQVYCAQAARKSDLDRTDLAREKTGVFTGSYAINPVSGQRVPIWVADYVLGSYGTGAIMAVPAHDLRDWEFAATHGLTITRVVQPPAGWKPSREERELQRTVGDRNETPFVGEGTATNSGSFNGMPTAEFKEKITRSLSSGGLVRAAVNYRLRDWLFSRQHFWGEPFPLWHELDDDGQLTGLVRTVDPAELPVHLPENFDFKPHGRPEPPLDEAPDEWLYHTAEDGTRLKRETNSMPQWAGSCWYYLRYADPQNETAFIDPEREKYWMPVDLYVGGAEHAVLHLLYSRFWHKVLFDRGQVSTAEPFRKLVNQGMILGEAETTGFQDGDGNWVSLEDVDNRKHRTTGEDLEAVRLEAEQVVKEGENIVLKDSPQIRVESRAYKMSKSRGNVINPDDVVQEYGADSLRLYEMFMGPLEQVKPWSMSGVEGVSRFLGRVWRLVVDDRSEEMALSDAVQDVEPTEEQLRLLHRTIAGVTDGIESMSFNTAISRMMEFSNELTRQEVRPRAILEPFTQLLAPFAPHLAEELWQLLGHSESLTFAAWPELNEALLHEADVEIPVQINGKVKGRVRVPTDATAEGQQAVAEQDESIAGLLNGATVVKVISVPGRLINFVIRK